MDQVTFAILTSLVLLGKFADFLMAAQPAEAPAPGGRRRPFARRAVEGAHEYLLVVFGDRFFHPRRLYRVLLVSAFLVQGSFLFSALIAPEVWRVDGGSFPFVSVTLTILSLIAVNYVADLIAISIMISLLESLISLRDVAATRTAAKLAAEAVAVFAVFYVLVVTTMNVSFSVILYLQGAAAGYDELFSVAAAYDMQIRVFQNETVWRFIDPIGEGRHIGLNGVNLFIFCLTPLLAPALALITALAGVALDISDAALSGRVDAAMRSMKERREPFFLKLASVLAVIGAGAATLTAAIGG